MKLTTNNQAIGISDWRKVIHNANMKYLFIH